MIPDANIEWKSRMPIKYDSELEKAVIAYLGECDNPVPDYGYRRTLRNRLRELVGAPPEPPSRQRS